MSLEWFDRVSGELQDYLESICDEYDEVGHMTVDRAAKHPRIEFFVETSEDESEYFCSLFFDPHNEEFYVKTLELDREQMSKTVLPDIEDIIDEVHESFHEFMEGVSGWEEDHEWAMEDEADDDEVFEQIDVEWSTPEVTAYAHEDEVEVTYQFGVIEETGDGVLRRVNRIKTVDNELLEDETNFIFSKEEANTIIAMIASHADSLSEFDFNK
ncbi:hypothetical protein ACP2W0_08430 [Pseudobacillus badius]|uniref:hypothetical protein n=1 Tax=Bacillus badius TaxID=1455 RepID=UPI0007B09039|nr:hypothetical protein [Bacillus badius]KZN99562.1 hypothetical protein A4244_16275 [Bacillus badius]MED0665918.1 hypothetical protein [Bacillus badius]OCS85666.1 hypothetical protein A6M11_16290 [Bacillus badius]OVE51980.1 hypothetical protein B1A98_10560 [Bacillus badius]TDW03416.1 hypothetical protein B0G66_104329 [Bacillus badius]